jgi:hypothetical protein
VYRSFVSTVSRFLCRKSYLSGNLISVDCICPFVQVTWENPKDIEVYLLNIY